MAGAWEQIPPQVLVAVLAGRDAVATKWAIHYRSMQLPPSSDIHFLSGMPFDHARNTACDSALKLGFQWLFFLDDDVLIPPDTIPKLVSRGKPIISGLYYRRVPPIMPVALLDTKPKPTFIGSFNAGDVFEVDLVGAGCLLIHRSVLESMKWPWFDWRLDRFELPDDQKCSEDFAFCFPAGGWVYGKRVFKIEDVKVGQRVMTHQGSFRQVLGTNCRPYSGRMVRLTTAYGEPIEATPGHRIFARTIRRTGMTTRVTATGFDGVTRTLAMPRVVRKTDWVEAADVREGDWIYIPKPKMHYSPDKVWHLGQYISLRLLTEENGKLGYHRTRKAALKVKKEIDVTPELCRLIGYAVAEGSAFSKTTGYSFAFGDHEPEVIKDCCDLLKSVFDATGVIRPEPGTHAVKVNCSSKVLGRLFSALCGRGAQNKRFPREWYKLDDDCLTELLKGYWRGDGSYDRNHGFSMVTASEQLAHEVRFALLRLGVLSSIHQRSDSGAFTISIPGPMNKKFGSLVGYPCDDLEYKGKWSRMRESKTHFQVQVMKTEEFIYEGNVYNLKVAGVESYTLNGLAVHNCRDAKAKGHKIWLDTSVQCQHVGYGKSSIGGSYDPLTL